MNTRIKYLFEGTIGISRQVYGTKNGNARVIIDKENFTFEIVDTDNKPIVQGGKTKNYAVLLRQAKRALVALGCDFAPEDRDRDYGVIRKSRNMSFKRILSKRNFIKLTSKLKQGDK